MKNKVGFVYDDLQQENQNPQIDPGKETVVPRRSVVQVNFSGDERSLSYYNDQFDLKKGDLVFVEGAFEGTLGRVVGVNYNFRIKLSQYKRVIAVADTDVHGQFYMAGAHCVTFDRQVLPVDRAATWYFPPQKDTDEFVSGSDESSFHLDDLTGMRVSPVIMERGHDYFLEHRVRYLCLDGTKGYAIVEGTHPYAVEFTCCDGKISSLTCDCYCSYPCKHEVAVMLQLQKLLEKICKDYAAEFEAHSYFAAVYMPELMYYVMSTRETGSITI